MEISEQSNNISDINAEVDNTTILIRNLNLKYSKEDLRRIFKECGEIKKISLIKKEKNLIDAKISFESMESILNVIESKIKLIKI